MAFEAACRATAIGSLPHKDARQALELMLESLPDIPAWPQLPALDFRENMYAQFSEGMPGIVVDEANERIYFDNSKDLLPGLQQLYETYIAKSVDGYGVSPSYASGLSAFIEQLAGQPALTPAVLKGQITGPISFGLTVTDQNKRPSLYDDTLRDIILKTLSLKAKWQEGKLRELRPEAQTLIFLDEPYLVSLGSAFVSVTRDDAMAYLEEVLGSIEGLTGIHCCGNTDWSLLAETSVDVISFDAFDYAEALSLYASDIHRFLSRGGIIAWGIVPTGLPTPDQIAKESTDSLVKRLEDDLDLLVSKGIDRELVLKQALITPNCGMGSMSLGLAQRSLSLTHGVSQALREKYFPIV